MDWTRCASLKINFLGVVPESGSSSRNTHGASIPPLDGSEGGPARRAELRLRALCSLPATHQQYLYEKVGILCRGYLRKRRVSTSEITPEELLSEIYQKLLGTVSMADKVDNFAPANPIEWRVDSDAPERDGRVIWLVEEIGGFDAIAHRHEDILRQRFGRSQPGRGRPIVQPGIENETIELGSDPDQPITLQQVDAYHAWRGLLAMADHQFQQRDDVSILLRVLNDFRDILEESSAQWPIGKMVALLNERHPPPTWTDDRVDNAKRRLVKWIKGLMQKNGLDAIDLEGLFARVARLKEGSGRVSLMRSHRPKLTN
jgi:hypothetical protein